MKADLKRKRTAAPKREVPLALCAAPLNKGVRGWQQVMYMRERTKMDVRRAECARGVFMIFGCAYPLSINPHT